jgi:hypothetical protein
VLIDLGPHFAAILVSPLTAIENIEMQNMAASVIRMRLQ